MRIAIQGERGSFSEEAAGKFLARASVVPCASFAEAYERLGAGAVDAALLPIENSLAGTVAENADLLLAKDVFVQREFRLRIRHNLIAAPGVRLRDVRRVFSHPVALEQCRDFFRAHRSLHPLPFYDTAGSVKHVIQENLRDAAAIAGARAADVYQAQVLKAGLEDDKRNFTRFLLIRKHRRILPGANKTSVAFSLKNQPGALFKALSVFALRDIDLSKIESRPRRGRPWEYVFYVDFLRGEDEASANALRHLGEIAEFVRTLGVYPAAE